MAVAGVSGVQPVKPQDAHYSTLISSTKETVDGLKAKLAEVNEKIGERSGGREEYIKQRDQIRNEITAVNTAISRAEEERRELSEREARTSDANRFSKSKLESIQKNVPYRSVARIDERLNEIDYMIMTTTMTSKEEKALKMEADKLRKVRPEVAEMEKIESQLESAASTAAAEQKANVAMVNDKRIALRDELRNLRDKRDALRTQLQILESNRADTLAPLRDLFDQRDDIRSQIAEQTNKLTELQNELQAKEIESKAEIARKKQAKIEIERFDRQIKLIEQDKKSLRTALANSAMAEYDWTMSKATQMREYLDHEISVYERAQDKSREATTPETKATTDGSFKSTDLSPEKVQLNNQTEEVVVVPKKHKKTPKPAPVSQYLNHSLASLKDLKSLDVNIPKTIDEAKETLKELDAIIAQQSAKLAAADEIKMKKQAELEKRLEQILAKEREILAKAPQGWKPTATA